MTTPIKGFFAYPSAPEICETIRNGVERINQTGVVTLKTWETMRVGGKSIIGEICKDIEESSFFCADLTRMNHNVMFELGFAIARNKRIWLVVDPSVTDTKLDLVKLKLLTTIGYAEYCNSNDVSSKFLAGQPWMDLEATIFNESIKPNLPASPQENILYLKSRHATEASTLISKEVAKAANAVDLPLIVDDPRETTTQPLSWYGEQVFSAKFVVVHLINASREGAHVHNAKYALISGLAFGLDKPLLMLAHGDSLAPLDYRNILRQYQTGSEAERHLQSWILPIIEGIKKESHTKQLYLANVKLAQQLKELRIGEPIAENEADRLVNEYFVETATYREAFSGRERIFVGRKGAGKTANFLKLSTALQSDRRNLVCVIKPLSYEMHGIVELLRRYPTLNLKEFAIESIWKFLIYSEIALSAEAAIVARPSGQIQLCEKNLIALLDQDSEMLRKDFSVRLERCIGTMLAVPQSHDGSSIERVRNSISEVLHAGLIKKLREVLVEALSEKQRVAVVVDNLDKGWDKQTDIKELSEFLLGLLTATNRVASDFRGVGQHRRSLDVSLAVFVRADIFFQVMAAAREPDKILHARLTWTDDEMLLRVIEERFVSCFNLPPSEIWMKYFAHSVRGLPAKQYFLSRILKRPRDLLFFVKAAITVAVNRRHGIVEEKDILDAEKQYSQFALDSILVENGVTITQLERIIYGFVGCHPVLTESEIKTILEVEGVTSAEAQHTIKHLCDLTFLGVEVKNDEFRFAEDYSEVSKNAVLAERLFESRQGPRRYRIHTAFASFLELM